MGNHTQVFYYLHKWVVISLEIIDFLAHVYLGTRIYNAAIAHNPMSFCFSLYSDHIISPFSSFAPFPPPFLLPSSPFYYLPLWAVSPSPPLPLPHFFRDSYTRSRIPVTLSLAIRFMDQCLEGTV